MHSRGRDPKVNPKLPLDMEYTHGEGESFLFILHVSECLKFM